MEQPGCYIQNTVRAVQEKKKAKNDVVLIPLAFWLDVSPVERALMVAVSMLSLIVELLNSAVEAAIDRISLERHPLSKNAKDMGSAAQLTSLVVIGLVWAIILLG